MILLNFLSFLLVLPEYCLTPITPPLLFFIRFTLMFGPNVRLSDLHPPGATVNCQTLTRGSFTPSLEVGSCYLLLKGGGKWRVGTGWELLESEEGVARCSNLQKRKKVPCSLQKNDTWPVLSTVTCCLPTSSQLGFTLSQSAGCCVWVSAGMTVLPSPSLCVLHPVSSLIHSLSLCPPIPPSPSW